MRSLLEYVQSQQGQMFDNSDEASADVAFTHFAQRLANLVMEYDVRATPNRLPQAELHDQVHALARFDPRHTAIGNLEIEVPELFRIFEAVKERYRYLLQAV